MEKMKFVITMNNAGTLMIICTNSGLLSAKWAWMTPSAGATAAPAITVKRKRDRMLTVKLFLGIDCSDKKSLLFKVSKKRKSA